VNRNFESFQKNVDADKKKIADDYERRIKQLQDDLDRMKSSSTRRGVGTSPEQVEELSLLKDKIRKLEL
jgi:hypothetical protein